MLRTAGRVAFALICGVPFAAAAQAPAHWRLVTTARAGDTDNSTSELQKVTAIEVSRSGTMLVLDGGADAILVFSPTGTFLRSIGRKGSGPGELLRPNGWARAPDGTIWITDPGNHRYSVHADDGHFLRDVNGVQGGPTPWDGTFDTHGRLMFTIFASQKDASGRATVTFPLQRIDPVSGRADTIPAPYCTPDPIRQHPLTLFWRAPGTALRVPFMPRQPVRLDRDGTAWCAHGSVYTVYHLGLAHGDTIAEIHGRRAPLPVTAAERDSAMHEVWAYVDDHHIDRSLVDPDDVPRVHPAVLGLTIDDDERLWVRVPSPVGGQTDFDVYRRDGTLLATVTADVAMSEWIPPLMRGDQVYAVTETADGEPQVVRLAVRR